MRIKDEKAFSQEEKKDTGGSSTKSVLRRREIPDTGGTE